MPWYAIYVKSRSEKKVVELLQEKQIETYAPIIKTMRQWSDRKKMVELPLINGYVFVNFKNTDTDKILQTKGVVNFVKDCGNIAVIREDEIYRLKQLVELGYHLEASAIDRNFSMGDKVKITSGALKNIEGYINDTKEGRTIEIILESMGQLIKVKLPKDIIISI